MADIEGRVNNFIDVSDFVGYTGEENFEANRMKVVSKHTPGRSIGRSVGWLGYFWFVRLACWLVCLSVGWLGWWLVGWFGWLIGWLACWLEILKN